MTTITITAANAVAVADMLNDRFAAGALVSVNGREVWAKHSRTVATSWQNGTVSVRVRGRSKGVEGTVHVKDGQTLTFA